MRHWYLGTPADWAMALGADETSTDGQSGRRSLVIPDSSLTFWTMKAGGDQYLDLLDEIGTPITEATATDDGAWSQIQGPDSDPDVWFMWADGSGGAGPRRMVLATDIGDTLTSLLSRMGDLEEQMDAAQALLAIAPMVVREGIDGTWPERPDIIGARLAMWVGPDTPSIGGGYASDDPAAPDLYVDTLP